MWRNYGGNLEGGSRGIHCLTLQFAAEIISSIFGLISTYMLTKGDGKGWILAALMALMSAFVWFHAGIYGSMGIQIVFFLLALAGVVRWLKGAEQDLRKISRRMTAVEKVLLVLVWSASAFGLGLFLQSQGGSLPFLDATGTVGNTLAQLTLIACFPECWLIYMTTNLCYITTSYLSGLKAYTVLYCVYMTVAYRGWRQWTSAPDLVKSEADSVETEG